MRLPHNMTKNVNHTSGFGHIATKIDVVRTYTEVMCGDTQSNITYAKLAEDDAIFSYVLFLF